MDERERGSCVGGIGRMDERKRGSCAPTQLPQCRRRVLVRLFD